MAHLKRIVIAGTHSGVGKSTVTLAIMSALCRRGLRVQGFKVGPDYIDSGYHTAVTGRSSRNLDSWMLAPDVVKNVFSQAASDADISVIEGVMGLYDGRDPLTNEGSTAEISVLLECPVVLVIDAYGMARSAAATVKGYQMLDPSVTIAGVIANRVGSEGHYHIVQEAVESSCGVPMLGYLMHQDGIEIPERHLGLVPAIERGQHDDLMNSLGTIAMSTLDLDGIFKIADSAAPMAPHASAAVASREVSGPRVQIAIARDEAFNFYYPENLELLEQQGAKLVYFSPLRGECIPPGSQGLYIGGGFPEEFAAELSSNEQVKHDIRSKIRAGLPTYAECGGYMYLAESITNSQGETFSMVGVLHATVSMHTSLKGFGYREVKGTDDNWFISSHEMARGHEFHYSTIAYANPARAAYETLGYRWTSTRSEGFCSDTLVAGYTHIHFASNPAMAKAFVEKCRVYQRDGSEHKGWNGVE